LMYSFVQSFLTGGFLAMSGITFGIDRSQNTEQFGTRQRFRILFFSEIWLSH